jgi:hypothetical protein
LPDHSPFVERKQHLPRLVHPPSIHIRHKPLRLRLAKT